MLRVGSLLLCAGCGFEVRLGNNSGGDASIDAPMQADAFECAWNPQPRHLDACMYPPGSGMTINAATDYNTDSGVLNPGPSPTSYVTSDGVRVISVASLTVTSTGSVRFRGTKPVLVLSWSTLDIAGTLDASSKRTGGSTIAGPGARTTNASVGSGGSESGGGGGGGYGTGGASGGAGNSGGNAGGNAGTALVSPPSIIAGGYAGAKGGGGVAGNGGAGGGALQLTAMTSISVRPTARIDIGGAGGEGTNGDAGGGGGGSGGYLGFDAPMITLESGAIVAGNGGGGGEGCDNSANGAEGGNGGMGTGNANGGTGSGCASAAAGGRGGADAGGSGPGVQSPGSGGGGGGGGGCGFILSWGTITNMATTSPSIVAGP